uniref:Transmembrane 9 superfamily member n=1 Tax=Lotharella globosa TaxID=91324 RepID=A0A7S4DYJ3_9EUKA|mmetsp:Transcript_9031/g.17655  ORF Transcript_9031/g.17655 Transcript_9031/m.17655 type:complete len:592 (+) Transcript_9031:79-1854(+)
MRAYVIALVLGVQVVGAKKKDDPNYRLHEKVPVQVNNVGPFHNPAETYEFYSLPYCAPESPEIHDHDIGSSLAGDRRTSSLYDLRFRVDIQWHPLCEYTLMSDEVDKFISAIKQNYLFEMFVDGLPVKGFIGEMETTPTRYQNGESKNETSYYLFTHLEFSLAYNKDNVIAVNLTTDARQRRKLTPGNPAKVEFSYSAQWKETEVPYSKRMSILIDAALHDQSVDIHWLSIVNSFVLVILLTSFLAIILMRILRKDFARYMQDTEEADDDEEVGWKRIHGDVFRPPPYLMIFTAMVGSGAQILALSSGLLVLALIGMFYPGNRGALYVAAIVLYALTASVAGYVSTNLYVKLGGKKWATNAVLAAGIFTCPFFCVFSIVNMVAIYYGSTSALPLHVVFMIIVLFAVVTFPLSILGSMRAKKQENEYKPPCPPNVKPRELPAIPWYRSSPFQMLMAGFLPFSAIYIELHYIFASVWGHRVYTLFGILTLAFLILLVVTAFVTVALTYFQIAMEDYRWWWRSLLSGGSTGVFVFLYAAFYYYNRSEMNGALQFVFFFGYMFLVSYGFFLMLGAVGYWMANVFITHIYLTIKVE